METTCENLNFTEITAIKAVPNEITTVEVLTDFHQIIPDDILGKRERPFDFETEDMGPVTPIYIPYYPDDLPFIEDSHDTSDTLDGPSWPKIGCDEVIEIPTLYLTKEYHCLCIDEESFFRDVYRKIPLEVSIVDIVYPENESQSPDELLNELDEILLTNPLQLGDEMWFSRLQMFEERITKIVAETTIQRIKEDSIPVEKPYIIKVLFKNDAMMIKTDEIIEDSCIVEFTYISYEEESLLNDTMEEVD